MSSDRTMLIVLEALKANQEGCGDYLIGQNYGIARTTAYHCLKDLEERDIVKKVSKGKFKLIKQTFTDGNGGLITFDNEDVVLFHKCKYIGECPCVGVITEDCRKYQELPKYIKDQIQPMPKK